MMHLKSGVAYHFIDKGAVVWFISSYNIVDSDGLKRTYELGVRYFNFYPLTNNRWGWACGSQFEYAWMKMKFVKIGRQRSE